MTDFHSHSQFQIAINLNKNAVLAQRGKLETFKKGNLEVLKNMPAEAYDVVCNGYELASGSVRIHDSSVQGKMFEYLGLNEEEIKSQFGFFINAITPPTIGGHLNNQNRF